MRNWNYLKVSYGWCRWRRPQGWLSCCPPRDPTHCSAACWLWEHPPAPTASDLWPPTWCSSDLLLAALPGGGRLQFWGWGRQGQGPRPRSPERELPGHAIRPASLRPALLASTLQGAPVLPSRAVSASAVRPEPEHLGTDLGGGRWRRGARAEAVSTWATEGRMACLRKVRLEGYMSQPRGRESRRTVVS